LKGLKSDLFVRFGRFPGFQIRVVNTHPDPGEPHQCGSIALLLSDNIFVGLLIYDHGSTLTYQPDPAIFLNFNPN
jgi:hypothetical protein